MPEGEPSTAKEEPDDTAIDLNRTSAAQNPVNPMELSEQWSSRPDDQCERNKWAEEARAYNELIASWHAIAEESRRTVPSGGQMELFS
ncbi:MAG: hypothetical protein HY900_34675 [Deltaproteobacteria bacterium]|nr:hypothetical protein [Deltaproteobacteria bacterium]